ncbi:hypothetical protein PHLCEN_2v11512 [Hermanssonia centrifuga]|uniref:Uncharacterized protein n=1 Tax=Hermanssonia centrifuga TaxID=98765 RepID=A0A2R6NK62_9APHY|nr:hypothetical protein PHLCEN_2v11512 [Hermanssonia centrifuga]
MLVAESLSMLVRLPLFIVPLLVHAPVYFVGRLGAKLVEDEEETQAQNKVVFGLLLLILMYGSIGVFLWAMLWYTPAGALLAAGFVFLFAKYHNTLINDNYEHAKRLVAAWRILVGVWAPKHWDLSLTALAQYTIPRVPPENPWIDRPRTKSSPTTPNSPTPLSSPTPTPQSLSHKAGTPSSKTRKQRRPPSRRLVRHVLRARVEAAKALGTLFEQLDHASDGKRVRASSHLAQAFGGVLDEPAAPVNSSDTLEGVGEVEMARGWRNAKEVLSFLRNRGAKMGTLEHSVAGDWAALSSEGEGDGTECESDSGFAEDLVWVPSTSNLRQVL